MTSYATETAELDKLRASYPLGTLELSTVQGQRWKRRVDEDSEAYFRRYSAEWEPNRELLCDFKKMVSDFGTYVAIAYPIVDNYISDVYFKNPDPLLQDKNGDRDISRILTDVIRSVHMECDTEREMRDALQDQTWASFGVIGASFEQGPRNAGDAIMEPTGEVGVDGPVMRQNGYVQPTEQKVIVRRISPWLIRFDPKGRRWDLSDHRYVAFDTFERLGPLMRDPLLTNEDRARLMAYHSRGGDAFSVDDSDDDRASGYVECDPEFIRVAMRTIWSRADHQVYRKPFGASFTFAPRPWDEEWLRADQFPVHYVARKRIPENKKNTEGFIGMADLTLIRPHVLNINKAQGLLTNALSHVIDVYITIKGALDNMATGKIEDAGRMFRIIGIDPDALKKYPQEQFDKWKWDDFIHLLPTGDTRDMQHMVFIDHEFGLIQQIFGQGPADRGGVTDSETATQSLGQQQGLRRRMSANRNDAGRHYNAITKMIFLIIQARHTLPLRYQMTTAFNQKSWNTFVNPVESLKNVDLHFEYATGSTEARTRDQEFALRERMANILMPVFQAQQNWRMVMKLAQDLIEPLNILNAEQYFNDEVSAILMQLMTIMRGLAVGKVGEMELTADNAVVIQQIPELITALAQAVLTPQQLAEVEAQVQGVPPPESGGGGVGSLEKPPSPGEASAEAGARGSAAAGMTGGLESAG